MNNLAFQIYGSKKPGVFQSTWDTTITTVGTTEYSNNPASGTNWTTSTNLNTTASTHTVGFTNELVSTRNAIAMQTYQIVCTLTGTSGSIQVKFGNTTSVAIYPGTTTISLIALTTDFLRVIPTSDFNGTVRVSVKDSSSASNQVKLPLPNTGTYNIWVDWGDGTSDNITAWNQANTIHTYPIGITTPTIRISGNIFNWNFSSFSTGDKLKIKTISSWGKLKLGTASFQNCSNLTMSGITDVPDLSTLTSFSTLFTGCSKITTIGRLNEWNTINITNFFNCFGGCTLFNQELGNWKVDNATTLQDMFSYAPAFNNGGSSSMNSWNVSKVTTFLNMFFGATAFNNGYASGVANQLTWAINTMSLVSMSNMFYSAASFNANLGTGTTQWNVSKVTTFQNMFLGASKFNNGDELTMSKMGDWNIGGDAAVISVNMTSMFNGASIFNRDISTWNVTKVTNTSGMFAGTGAFNQPIGNWERTTPGNVSTTGNITDTSSMFSNAKAFNKNLSSWDMRKVTTMASMFNGNSNTVGSYTMFNNGQTPSTIGTNPLTWRTSPLLTSLGGMFYNHYFFNQDISSWDVSGVTNMAQMFYHDNGDRTYTFNNGGGNTPLNSWVPSSCQTMNFMFTRIAFNQCIGNWNVNKVTSFDSMFFGCSAFNNGDNSVPMNNWNINTASPVSMTSMFHATGFDQDISGWNVSKVTSFASMFNTASIFNNGGNTNNNPVTNRTGIDGWNINSTTATNMSSMFQSTPKFNRNISNWDMSKVSTTSNMFNSTGEFDQPIGELNITYVPDVSGMFGYASKFNQPLANWERVGSTTSYITNMSSMFTGARLFNQDISNWNVSGVTNFSGMFSSNSIFNNGLNTGTNLITDRTGIDGWNINTAAPVNMSGMFAGGGGDTYVVFDRPIGNWNTSAVNNMSNMFGKSGNGNAAFNQYIGDWDTSNVINMSYMFNAGQGDSSTSKFNQDISKWNVTKVTDFSYMLAAKQFNNGITVGQNTNPVSGLSGLNGWVINTASASVNMQYMFYRASTFNRDISEWNMTKVTNTGFMFNGATIFNQPLANWERIGSTLSGVTNMSTMFSGATAFQQYIGNWNISNVSNFINFMSTKTTTTFPTQYLDDIYTGWSALPSVKPSISISFNTAASTPAPSTAATAKAKLKATPNNWIIVEATNP